MEKESSNAPDRIVRVAELRALLAAKFPQNARAPVRGRLCTGVPSLDTATQGPCKAAVTEVTGSVAGGTLLLHAIVRATVSSGGLVALLDGGSTGAAFDPTGCLPIHLNGLLWVQCASPLQAVKAADLLLRDGNLPLVLMDLQSHPARAIHRIPSSTWHRFHRLTEQSGSALLVFTTQPVVEGAHIRVLPEPGAVFPDLCRIRDDIIRELPVKVLERHAAHAGHIISE